MSNNHKFSIIFLSVSAIGGLALFFFTGLEFLGAALFGSTVTMLLLVTIGRSQAKKAGERLDRIIREQQNF